jgi:hypothetical protein
MNQNSEQGMFSNNKENVVLENYQLKS